MPVIKTLCTLTTLVIAAVVPVGFSSDDSVSVTATTVDQRTLTFAVGKAAKFSTTVNGRSHQQTPLTTHQGYQYAAYYDSQRQVCIARRKLPGRDWDVIRFVDHKIKTNDAHNTVVIGICHADGTIHLAFDHHASQLNYRVSQPDVANKPEEVNWDSSLFGEIQHSLGSITPETRVTYPRFFNAPNGNLLMYYRGGTSGNGDGCIEEYNGVSHHWTEGLGRFIARDQAVYKANGKESSYRCPYMNDLCYSESRLHASWIWRDRFSRTKAVNQHDLCYVYSDDHGRTWRNSDGVIIGKVADDPIYLDSPGLVVAQIPIGSGLTNSNTQYAYPDGSIHIVMAQHMEGTQNRRYRHHWRSVDGKWSSETLPGNGQRPKLLGDGYRSLLLVFNEDEDRLRICKGTPNADLSAWSWQNVELPVEFLIAGEPLVDFARWEQEKALSIYCQQQPEKLIETKESGPVDGFPTPLHVLDVEF